MSMDFERTKHEFSGRSILVTSWYDEQKQNWQAGAPRYSHIQALSSPGREICASRKAAIEQVIRLLTIHFTGKEAASSEGVFFL